jgi:hypothetical protein
MAEPLDLDAIAAEHYEDAGECYWCEVDWPCRTAALVALARAQAAELAQLRAELADIGAHAVVTWLE